MNGRSMDDKIIIRSSELAQCIAKHKILVSIGVCYGDKRTRVPSNPNPQGNTRNIFIIRTDKS